MSELYNKLKNYGRVKVDEPLSKHTTFKIGGPAKYFVIIDDVDKLIDLLKYLDEEGENYYILGGGSNVLASDEGFDGVVVKIQDSRFKINDTSVEATAGILLGVLGQKTVEAKLGGLEWAVGIPGTVAGAIYGNAGCFGYFMSDIVEKVEVYKDAEILEFSNEECGFGYKESVFKNEGGVILRVWLKLKKLSDEDYKKTKQEITERILYRTQTQPKEKPNAGCVFKNLVLSDKEKERLLSKIEDERVKGLVKKYGKLPAGFLVEQVGMKGGSVGGAQVSEKHGNFIVNNGGAKAQDVLDLVDKIKSKVYNEWGVNLEEEVQLID